MRYLVGLLMSALLLTSAALSGAAFAAEHTVTIYNATGYGIKFIGVNTPGDDDFDENELEDVLRDGENVEISYDDEDGCRWNIKMEWELPGYPAPYLENIDLCAISAIRLMYDRANAKTYYQTR